MGWFSACGQFIGSATSAYVRTSIKLKKQELVESTDFCPDETNNLGKNDYFGPLLGIDANTKPSKRVICIVALKTAAKFICTGYDEDGIRAVTYSYLASRYNGLD